MEREERLISLVSAATRSCVSGGGGACVDVVAVVLGNVSDHTVSIAVNGGRRGNTADVCGVSLSGSHGVLTDGSGESCAGKGVSIDAVTDDIRLTESLMTPDVERSCDGTSGLRILSGQHLYTEVDVGRGCGCIERASDCGNVIQRTRGKSEVLLCERPDVIGSNLEVELHCVAAVTGSYEVACIHGAVEVIVTEHLLSEISAGQDHTGILREYVVDEGGTSDDGSTLGGEGECSADGVSVIKQRVEVVDKVCVSVVGGQGSLIHEVVTSVKTTVYGVSDDLGEGGCASVHSNTSSVVCDLLRNNVEGEVLRRKVGEYHVLIIDLIEVYDEFIGRGEDRCITVVKSAVVGGTFSASVGEGTRAEGQGSLEHYANSTALTLVGDIACVYALTVSEDLLNVNCICDNSGQLNVDHSAVNIESSVCVGGSRAKSHQGRGGKLRGISVGRNNCHSFVSPFLKN